jgi:hypothetical protein
VKKLVRFRARGCRAAVSWRMGWRSRIEGGHVVKVSSSAGEKDRIVYISLTIPLPSQRFWVDGSKDGVALSLYWGMHGSLCSILG